MTDLLAQATEKYRPKRPASADMNGLSAPVFVWPVRVYWEDTDAGGIVFYANYLRYFERARTEWLRSLGLGQQALRDTTGGMFVVTDASLHYHRPARLDDALEVTVQLCHLGRSRIDLVQQAWCVAPLTHGHSDAAQPAHVPKAGTSAPAKVSVESGRAQQRHLLCAGEVRAAWVQAADMRPQRLPASVLHALQSTG